MDRMRPRSRRSPVDAGPRRRARAGILAPTLVSVALVVSSGASAQTGQPRLRGPAVGILGTMIDLRVYMDHVAKNVPVTVQVRNSGHWVTLTDQTVTVTGANSPGRPRIRLRTSGIVSYRVIAEDHLLGPWTVNVVQPLRKRLTAGRIPERLATGPAGVWVVEYRPDLGHSTLRRLHTMTGATTWTSLDHLSLASRHAITVGPNAVYIQRAPSTITRIDARTNAEVTHAVADSALSMSAGRDGLGVHRLEPDHRPRVERGATARPGYAEYHRAVASQRPDGSVGSNVQRMSVDSCGSLTDHATITSRARRRQDRPASEQIRRSSNRR